MDNKNKANNQDTELLEKNRKQTRDLFAKKNQEDDDESGGGHGKSQKGFFKQEKLLKLIDKGRFNAQHFWRFLNREGADQHSLKETTLEKFADEKLEKQESEENVKLAEEAVEKIQERQMDDPQELEFEDQETSEQDISNEKDLLKQEEQEKTAENQQQVDLEEMTRKAIKGDKLAGSIIGAHHGNPLGFAHATSNQATATQQTQISNDNALQGKAAPFGALFANPHGLTVTQVQAGAVGSALTDNVKAQQNKQNQNEKNNPGPAAKSKR